MNIAFVTTCLFGRPGNGGEMCSARLMNGLLRAGHRLHAIGRGAVPAPGAAPDGVSFHSVGAGVSSFDLLSQLQRVSSLLGAWRAGQASTVHRLNDGLVPQQVVARLNAQPMAAFDAIVVDHLQAYAWVAAAQTTLPPMLLMMHNLESEGYTERAAQAAAAGRSLRAAVFHREARLLRSLEGLALRHAAAVACLSEGDAQALRTLAAATGSRPPVHVLPGFPSHDDGVADGRPSTGPLPTPGGRRRIGLLGTWTWGPNREGLDWMLDQVLPHLPKDSELVLAGQGLTARAPSLRVRVLGRVDSVQQFYDQVDVVAVPSWTGSGVHEKAIEAVARARVVVATPHALRGLGDSLPAHVHVAEQAADFAHLCAQAGPGPNAAAATARWAAQRHALYEAGLQQCLDALADTARCDDSRRAA